jgi:SpoVK/Ycf46/Vps4 family AAA+-type ATPase
MTRTLPPPPPPPPNTHAYRWLVQVVPPAGVLLHGPTGCGKSALAAALGGVANAVAAAAAVAGVCATADGATGSRGGAGVSLLRFQCSLMLGRWLGDSERAIRAAFAAARALAPCILVLDAVDVIGSARAGGAGGGTGSGSGGEVTVQDRMLSTLLNELDGVGSRGGEDATAASSAPPGSRGSGAGVLVVATTGSAVALDAALLRSGRLDVHVAVHPPTAHDRAAAWHAAHDPRGVGDGAEDAAAAFVAATHGLSMGDVVRAAAATAAVA